MLPNWAAPSPRGPRPCYSVPPRGSFLTPPVRERVSLSLRDVFMFARGWLRTWFCPAGWEQSLGLRIERSPPTRLRVRPSWHRPACGPSLFPYETLSRGQRFHPPVWPLGARTLRRNGSYRPLGGLHPHPPAARCATGGGRSIHRCRGWPIPPEPAGTGRASRIGETAAQHHANAEGRRRGSRPPVAGGGVCGRRTRGRPRPHGRPPTAPAKQRGVTQ
jgi:hypothetical protein